MKNFKINALQFINLSAVFFLVLLMGACKSGSEDATSKMDNGEVEFALQDFPVNSPSYTYEDSVALKEDMATFQLEPGLRIELVAAEPLIIDPVAFAFDEDKVMYVVENRGYPDPAEGGTPTRLGRIIRLEDTDGDGRFDHKSEFVTGLTYPNGILPWKGGVFVTSAPDIFYFKDTNGDGIADVQKVVLTGFNSNRTAQIRVSHPILGLDGWVYVTSGLNGGEVHSPEHPERPVVSFAAADGRFHPETLEFETTGGRSQFGLAFDVYGRRFGTSNRHPMQHIVMEPHFLKRNSHLLFNESIENVAKAEAEATVFPISTAVTSADFIPKLIGLSHKGTFTSACGLLVYDGSALGHDHVGNAFICEPAQNLVQRQIVEPEGVTFRSELPYEDREFLASTDTWFNPVFLGHGPEGALYLADIHRKVIDHPSYVPEEARGDLDFESGKNAGRIYRIVKDDFEQKNVVYDFPLSSSSSVESLVDALKSKEEWTRATAHRMLLERNDDSIVESLRQVAEKAEHPESRVRALWLLHTLGKLQAGTLENAIKDENAGVREQAIFVGEDLWNSSPALLSLLIASSSDESMRVRFASSLILGDIDDPKALSALATIAAQDGADKWARAAALSGIEGRLPEFLKEFRAQPSPEQEAFAEVMQDLGRLFGNGASIEEGRMLFKDMLSEDGGYRWRISTTLGLVEGLSGRSGITVSKKGLLYNLLGEEASSNDQQALREFLDQVADIAVDDQQNTRTRMVATALLGYDEFAQAEKVIPQLLDAKNPPEVQLEAVAALARLGDVRGGQMLTAEKSWKGYTPRVKAAAIEALVSKPVMVEVLFSAIEKGTVGPAEISSTYRQRLLNDKNKKISDQAELLFKDLEGGGRMQVYQEYREVLELPTDASLGKAVFEKTCSTCHTYAGEGGVVGPDLTGVNNQPADALLLHTLVPNYEVLPAYQEVSVETKDGRSLSGWLLSETDNSLTLRTAFGTEEPVLRSNIVSINNSGLSLMPDGLEQTMSKQELANLIAYLKEGG